MSSMNQFPRVVQGATLFVSAFSFVEFAGKFSLQFLCRGFRNAIRVLRLA